MSLLQLAPPFFVQEELAQGRLVDIAPRQVSGQRAYSLIYPEHKAELPALQAFASWLVAEAGSSPSSFAQDDKLDGTLRPNSLSD